jgi:thiamine-phosphate pyrophosphorylase
MNRSRSLGESRRERLRKARLYLVVEARPAGRSAAEVLRPALASGVDMVQLREKEADDETLLRAAAEFRALCDEYGALFWMNDRPDLAVAAGADGVHVGQGDAPADAVRGEVGEQMLVGLSTHSPEQFDAGVASTADELSVGPVWETPTKAGRPGTGLGLIRYAAERAGDAPWFAIGGIDRDTVRHVMAAGARRIVVVRAIRDAPDPGAAAAEMRSALEGRTLGPA